MIIKVRISDQVAIIQACGLRGIPVDFISDSSVSELCYANIYVDDSPTAAFYIGKEVGQIIEQDLQFNESCDRVSGSQNEVFNLLKEISRPQ